MKTLVDPARSLPARTLARAVPASPPPGAPAPSASQATIAMLQAHSLTSVVHAEIERQISKLQAIEYEVQP